MGPRGERKKEWFPTTDSHLRPFSDNAPSLPWTDPLYTFNTSCHMPMTEFARMRRSDHSMLPSTPAATIAWKSPNACNLCHADKDAAWADNLVRAWRPRDYQAPVLRTAGLVDAARKRDTAKAIPVLRKIVDRNQPYSPAYAMLGTIYEKQGKADEAKKVHRKAAGNEELPEPDRVRFLGKLQALGK